MTPIIQITIAFFIGLFIVLYTIPVIVRVSKAKHLYDVPDGRKVNTTVIPNLGGVALFGAITIATLLGVYKYPFDDFKFIMVSMVILFFIGLKDDIMIIHAHKKFIAQLISAFVLIVLGDIRFTHLHGILGLNEIGYVTSCLISLLAIVAIINSINLIDGIDGLAAAFSILATIIFGTNFLISGHFTYAILCFATTGSLSSFFIYNVFGNKNKIFMGDTGSLLLGLLLAVFVIQYNEFSMTGTEQVRKFSPVYSMAVLAFPLIDMIRVFSIRILLKKSPFAPDMNHIHHKLLRLGFSHLKCTLLIVGADLFLIAMVFSLQLADQNPLMLMLGSTAIVISFVPDFIYRYKRSATAITQEQ
ncbi:MAG TPA: MraY family glycosyltransferase [Prolixibacteraceae bacterium]|nr:MraY family glycosyltransferase [Prolixibacteraceae bacterium]